jgi:hypothetical protein
MTDTHDAVGPDAFRLRLKVFASAVARVVGCRRCPSAGIGAVSKRLEDATVQMLAYLRFRP